MFWIYLRICILRSSVSFICLRCFTKIKLPRKTGLCCRDAGTHTINLKTHEHRARVTQSMFKHPQDTRYRVTRFRWRYLRQPPGARIYVRNRWTQNFRSQTRRKHFTNEYQDCSPVLTSPLPGPEVDEK